MTQHVTVAIVGSGFAGLCMAIKLKEAGIEDFVLLERASDVGGTWRDNTYPGCACDVPSHLYSFSFEANPQWSRVYSPRREIQKYVQRCFDKYDIRRHVKLDARVLRADWEGGRWRLQVQGEQTITCDWLVSGMGGLSNPAYPDLKGHDRFQGAQFHSAEWNHDYDLTGKRVAVVGTGASAIQFVPEIQPKVGKLHLFQRTAPWVLPRPDRAFRDFELRTLERWPALCQLYRLKIYLQHEWRVLGFAIHPGVMKLAAFDGRQNIKKGIKNPALRELVTPTYTPGCKRILMSNDYYPAIDQPNVEVTASSIAEVKEHSIVTREGREIPVDAIIYGTGFKVQEYISSTTIRGREGRTLEETWRAGAEAYLGTSISGFPNFFMVTGPNTGLGHNSMIYMIESQVHYIVDAIKWARDRAFATIDVRASRQKSYNEDIQERLKTSVWASGCASWYLDEHGKNTTIWPGFTFAFRARTRHFEPEAYELERAAPPDSRRERSGPSRAHTNGVGLVKGEPGL